MDKYLVRKDVYDVLEKAMRDRSHLTQKKVTDKNGHQRTVWVRPGEEPVQQKTKKTEESGDKTTAKPKYEVGSSVALDGVKGEFKVSSIDEDGTYHVISANGKKGYKVSENHIDQNGTKNLAEKKKLNDEIDKIDFDHLSDNSVKEKNNNKQNNSDYENTYNQAEDEQDKKMSNVYKWDNMIRTAAKSNNFDEKKKIAEKIEEEYKEIKSKKLSEDETDYIEFFHDKAKKWLNGGVPSTNVSSREMPSGYVASLDEKTQNQLKQALKDHFRDQGMGRFEAAEAVQNAMDSKISDLQDIWNENQEIKTILWNVGK